MRQVVVSQRLKVVATLNEKQNMYRERMPYSRQISSEGDIPISSANFSSSKNSTSFLIDDILFQRPKVSSVSNPLGVIADPSIHYCLYSIENEYLWLIRIDYLELQPWHHCSCGFKVSCNECTRTTDGWWTTIPFFIRFTVRTVRLCSCIFLSLFTRVHAKTWCH